MITTQITSQNPKNETDYEHREKEIKGDTILIDQAGPDDNDGDKGRQRINNYESKRSNFAEE